MTLFLQSSNEISWDYCPTCDISFTTKRASTKHRQSERHKRKIGHFIERNATCAKCGQCFSRDSDRARHEKRNKCRDNRQTYRNEEDFDTGLTENDAMNIDEFMYAEPYGIVEGSTSNENDSAAPDFSNGNADASSLGSDRNACYMNWKFPSVPIFERMKKARQWLEEYKHAMTTYGLTLECPACAFCTLENWDMLEHIRTHVPSISRKFVCRICRFGFLEHTHLVAHETAAQRDRHCGLEFKHEQPCGGCHHAEDTEFGSTAGDAAQFELFYLLVYCL